MKQLITLLILGFVQTTFAQVTPQCLNDHLFDLSAYKKLRKEARPSPTKSAGIKYINTVVHVIYNDNQEDVSDEVILQLFEDLNDMLVAQSLDESLIHPLHRNKISHAQLQFCLAKKDESGNPTNGITHKKTEEYFSAEAVFDIEGSALETHKIDEEGGTSPWDMNKYLNIWIVPMEDESFNLSYGVPQPSFYPIGPLLQELNYDLIPGAVIDLDNMTFFDEQSYFELLGLFAHECGHALGLMHTFGASTEPLGFCEIDDLIEDTPLCDVALSPCNGEEVNSCDSGLGDLPDNHANFMSYSNCKSMFSPGQINVMSQNLNSFTGLFENACFDFSLIEKSNDPEALDLILFPNPNEGSFKILSDDKTCSSIEVKIYNAAGALVRDLRDVQYNEDIQLYNLGTGIFSIRVSSHDKTTTRKLIIKN